MTGVEGAGPRRDAVRRRRRTLGALVVAVIVAVVVPLIVVSGSSPGPSDTHPVDLATPVDMAAGKAHQSAVVRAGDARIEVLSPTLLRLEYSPSATFEDSPTVNAADRRMPVPPYRHEVHGGWLTVQTSALTFRYRIGSGPFTAADTSVRFRNGSQPATAHPTWEWECPFDQICQAGSATLAGGTTLDWTTSGYQSAAGYLSGLTRRGAAATWTVLGAPAGRAAVALRYSTARTGASSSTPATVALVVNGRARTLRVAPTDGARPWATLRTTVTLHAGTDSVGLRCDRGDSCTVEPDTLAVGPPGGAPPPPVPTQPLGGWVRGFDTFTYGSTPTCAPGTAGAQCANTFEPLHTDGLLDREGWRLLDDTRSALWTPQGWVQPRGHGGDVEDGYLFAYGEHYTGALRTLATLTGSSPLLPRSVFGVWYSDYTPYSGATIEGSVYPAFVRNGVPLDTLSLDTDWKAPNNWDGWEWNTALFPRPAAFVRWARSHGVTVTLNIHSSIALDDPQAATAVHDAGGKLPESACMAGLCWIWDWSSVGQAESNFALQAPLEREGVGFYWLDWCCDDSVVTMPGLTPDAWIGHLYAQEMDNRGERGFVLARIGSSNGTPQRDYPAGPWSDHTSAIAFTGDAWGTWATLAQEVALTPDEATIGEPYVSDDVGSYLGPPPQTTQDPPDLYARWVQFGTFQPLLRLHSNNEKRLPWQYPQPVAGIAESFLRLREALVPYTYTLAAAAHAQGLPMAQPLYLQYPSQSAAYTHPGEYLYGSDVLVAPVTSPGPVAQTSVWIPPGQWVDYFTGATLSGPGTVPLAVPLDRMPVFVRAGGIVPEAPPGTTAASGSGSRLVLDVFPGAPGSFSLYGDSGSGLGYTKGQSTSTPITDATSAPGPAGDGAVTVTVGPAHGHYRGAPSAVTYRIELQDTTAPSEVTVAARVLPRVRPGSDAPGWYVDTASTTVVVTTPPLATAHAATVTAHGAHVVSRVEPGAPSS